MGFNDNNFNNDSIFNSPELQPGYDYNAVNPQPTVGQGLAKFIDKVVNKFIEEPKAKRETRNLQKLADELFAENGEVLKVFYDFGCNIVFKDDFIELQYPQLDLVGKITIENDEAVFDETTQKIMEQLSKLVYNTSKLGDVINDYETQEFYPVGELVKRPITLNGKEVEVMTGMLVNPKGETKQVYYYKGKEVHPDEPAS